MSHPLDPEGIGPDEIRDHILVRAWLNEEAGKEEKDHCLSQVPPDLYERELAVLKSWESVSEEGGKVTLLSSGKPRAANLIRRHRLSECLFAFVLNLSEEAVHAQACRMEHEKVLTNDAVEGICSFLGHPPTCPHGRPIPPGDCCRLFVNEVRPLVQPLSRGNVGGRYKITFIAPKYHQLLERLSGLGVTPGNRLHLVQKRPSFVLRVEETEVALDAEIADGIYVVPQGS